VTDERPSARTHRSDGSSGTLFLVATPIGNLEDVSARALRVLREADVVAAEDTRHTRRFLQHFGIPARVVSLHEHNERARAASLVERVQAGESVALVTDAGSPGIADPGYPVVRAAVAGGVRVESIPTDAFLFAGFLPPRAVARRRRLAELSLQRETVVVFESPHRIEACLTDLEAVWGERPIALARELTKLHEQVLRGTAREVRSALRAEWKRGEMVLVLGGRTRAERGREREAEHEGHEEGE